MTHFQRELDIPPLRDVHVSAGDAGDMDRVLGDLGAKPGTTTP